MTYQEALDSLRYEIDEEGHCSYIEDEIHIAMKALEKQIPKKPKIFIVHEISNYKYGDCECGEHVMDDERYCSNCGQALDWSDNK